MTDDQAERLIDVLARFHADVHHDLKELSSQLREMSIASMHITGR